MKNKNMHIFVSDNPLFREKRLVYQQAPQSAPAPTPGAAPEAKEAPKDNKDNLRQLVMSINGLSNVLGKKTADQILENNPFADILIRGTAGMKPEQFEIANMKDASIGFMLDFKDGTSIDLGLEMTFGLMWPELKLLIRQLLPEGEFSDEAISAAAKLNNPDFKAFLEAVNTNRLDLTHPIVPPENVAKAKEFLLKTVVPGLPSTIAKEKEKLGAQVERGQLKQDIEAAKGAQAQTAPEAAESARIRIELERVFNVAPSGTDISTQESTFDKWIATTRRDYEKIDAGNWDLTNSQGLEKIRDDWVKVGIPAGKNNDFYNNIFKELSKCHDKKWLDLFKADTKRQKMYLSPAKHEDELQTADNGFYRAYNFYESVQSFMTTQDALQKATKDKQKSQDTEPIFQETFDIVKANAKECARAIKEGDWATAALYAVGIWAAYTSIKDLSAKAGDFKKYAIYGIALYFGHHVAKKGGYDIMKKLGIKDEMSEVFGTALDSTGRLKLVGAPSIDAAITLRCSEIEISDLYQEYKKTHPGGDETPDGFINPAEFTDAFPEFANFPVADKEHDKEYQRVGHELYLLAHRLKLSYEQTMMLDSKQKNYYGKSFEEALKEPMLANTKIRHLTAALMEYVRRVDKKGFLEPESIKKAKERMASVLGGTGMGGDFELAPLQGGEKDAVAGNIMGFHVVLVPDPTNKVYLIFPRMEYMDKSGNIPNASALGSIPFEGDATAKVKDLEARITAEVKTLVSPLYSAGGRIEKGPYYEGGKWFVNVSIPELAKYGASPKTGKAEISISETGLVSLQMTDLPFMINIDPSMDAQFPQATFLLAHLVNQPDMQILAPFYRARKIRFIEDHKTEPKFKIEVAGKQIEVTAAVKPPLTTPVFSIDAAVQQELLGDEKFRREYVEELAKSDRFAKPFEKLKALIDNDTIPEEFHFYIFSGIARMVKGITKDDLIGSLGLDFLSGSANEYYAESVLESQKQFLKYRLAGALKNAKNFQEARDMGTSIWHDALAELDGHTTKILEASVQHKTAGTAFDRDEFMGSVVDPLRRLGTVSAYYREALDTLERDAVGVFKLSGSDLTLDSHKKLAKLKSVFAYYTAYLDDDELNKLVFPPVAISKSPVTPPGWRPPMLLPDATPATPTQPPKELPQYDGYFRLEYFKYVRLQIIEQGQTTKTSFPDPEAWDIDSYEVWKEKQADALPLDPIDAQEPFEHDPSAMVPGPDGVRKTTGLETYYATELIEMRDAIKKIDGIDAAKVNDYMRTMEFKVQFVADIEAIHKVSGSRRSLQIQEVQRYVDKFALVFLTNKSFWANYPTMDKIKVLWRQLVTKIKE